MATFANRDPQACVYDSFRSTIAQLLVDSLSTKLTLEQAYDGVDYGKKGEDFTVALPRFRLSGKVEDLGKKVIDKAASVVASVSQDRAFLHFRLKSDVVAKGVLQQVSGSLFLHPKVLSTLTDIDTFSYGKNKSGEGKRIIIEYSSPNIAKSFHVGHLRSTIIGAFLANLYKACGWDVISMNYLGDWGTQFGLIATGFSKYGSQEELEKDAIKHLFDVYVKVNADAKDNPQVKADAAAWFKRMEDGEEDALKHWREWRELSIKKYKEEYARLNVSFDVYTGESEVSNEYMESALKRLEEKGIIEASYGAKLVDLEKHKLGKAVVRKKDGTSIYLTRDIGGAEQRYDKYKFDKMIYVISAQQDLHMAQFTKVMQLLEYPWAKDIQHVNYGLVLGMSTRKGTVVFLDQIIKEAGNVMHEQMMKNEEKYRGVENPEYTSQELGITGVKIQDMTAKRINNYTFTWDRMTSFEGDTGPYLQYAHVRLSSIARKNPDLLPLPPTDSIDVTLLVSTDDLAAQHARAIIFLLGTYPDVVRTALQSQEPSGVVTFCFRLSHAISTAWETVIVKGEKNRDKAVARLWMYECAREVLAAAMRLLGLRPLDRM
ncbi:arginyl-tRNA synthetase [Fistulina hepatica ATCC 64428]|uniref:arginine--tRNA ligase n=1 Tax=Fistulina hepatica ATCC 64428 TaxID=1128425 RepID=A0A0D7AP59_9AGAR|nr:arginyl-tRNA synthetase [Fistulina hepatica ATCC 64428]